jgi:hypothetical protein
MYTLYSMQRSGNSYKVRLALAQLGIPYRLVEVDILKGESRTPEFLAKNPHGQVPLLEAAPGRYLAESNAILWHLVSRTPLRPEHRIDRAEALQWMFFEQHSIEPNIGAASGITAISWPAATPSPTSRFMPILIWRTPATMTSPAFPRSAAGSSAWRLSRAMCRWSGNPRTRCRRNEAWAAQVRTNSDFLVFPGRRFGR